jgi:hypothetical protein
MIDTAEKRKSASGFHALRVPVVTPNASKDAEWRLQASGMYSGIAAGAPPASGGGNIAATLLAIGVI